MKEQYSKYYTVHYLGAVKQPVKTADLSSLGRLPAGTHVRAWVTRGRRVIRVWGAFVIDGVARFDLSAFGTLEQYQAAS